MIPRNLKRNKLARLSLPTTHIHELDGLLTNRNDYKVGKEIAAPPG